jgi:uncharacterized protein (TIGR02466 family)
MIQSDKDIFFFPEPFVFQYVVPEHQSVKQELKPLLDSFYQTHQNEEKYKWTDDTKFKSKICTNYNVSSQQKTWYNQQHLQSIVWNPVDKLLDKLGAKTHKCRLSMFWWNVYQQGDFAPLHNHGVFGISGVYLLHLNEPNKTVFSYNNRAMLKQAYDLEHYPTDHVKEGSVLLFPSSLTHSVDPAETTRMSISFNVEILP